MQAVQSLIYNLYRCGHLCGTKHLHHLLGNLLIGKGCVYLLHVVHHFVGWQLALSLALGIHIIDEVLLLSLLQQFDGCSESNKLIHARHVDAVIVGIANLRTATHQHYLAGMQAVQDAYDTLLQSGSAHDTVINDNQIIHVWFQTAVGDVIHMRCQIIAAVALGDKGAQLDVLDGNLLASDVWT